MLGPPCLRRAHLPRGLTNPYHLPNVANRKMKKENEKGKGKHSYRFPKCRVINSNFQDPYETIRRENTAWEQSSQTNGLRSIGTK